MLAEAEDERNPLLERLKFLAITPSNLDEFFIKRIGGLKQQAASGVRALTVDGRTPQEQIAQCLEVIRQQEKRQREILVSLLEQLKPPGIAVLRYEELSSSQQAALREYYITHIFPLVMPLAIDPAHPFPFISSLSLNLLVTTRQPTDDQPSDPAAEEPDTALARIKIPVGSGASRFVRVAQKNEFVLLEDVIAHNLDLLFPQVEILRCELFRVSRNANAELDEEEAELPPSLHQLSENVRIVSIVGPFLEHGRIYYFRNGGDEEYLIGSADAMTRNLESRVEVVGPVEDKQPRNELPAVLDCQLKPNRCQWEMRSDGSYVRSKAAESCQQYLIDSTEDTHQRRRHRRHGYAHRLTQEV